MLTAVALLTLSTHGVAADVNLEARKSGGERLKFRSGPVCMCSRGLSEKNIQEEGWIRRHLREDFKTEKPAASDKKQEEE